MKEDIIVSVKNIKKKFGKNTVLNDVSLDIPKGKAVTFIGHNGAGKSTLLKIIAKLINVSDGTVEYNGDVNISYIPEHFPKLNISAEDYLVMMGKIVGLSQENARKRSLELMNMFFMASMKETKMMNLSKGTLQKVGVIQALLVEPQILMLDEPLSGQDINSQNVFIREVNRLKAKGTTVIMSCHKKFLLNSITDIVYEIDGGVLKESEINKGKLAEYDRLIFDISKMSKEEFLKIISKYKENIFSNSLVNENKYMQKIAVESGKANDLIKEMLSINGELKEMCHENI